MKEDDVCNCGGQSCKAQSIFKCKYDTEMEFAVIIITFHINVKGFCIQNPSYVVCCTSRVKCVRANERELFGIIEIVPIGKRNNKIDKNSTNPTDMLMMAEPGTIKGLPKKPATVFQSRPNEPMPRPFMPEPI